MKLDPRTIDAATLARLSPAGFATFATKGAWRLAPHLDVLARRLVDAACGRCPRLMVMMPVRHGKSELTSKFLPSWYLGNFPDEPVILASYEAAFAASWGRKARDLLEAYGREVFGVRVSKSTRSASQWTIEGRAGGMFTTGVGGPLVGRGAKLLIIDDPVKNAEEACSKVVREKQWDWYRSTAFTRLEPGGAIIIVATRWHEDDLCGRILREAEAGGEAWVVIRFPAIAEDDDPLGRAPGDALWPARFSAADLDVKRRAVGSHWWSAVYQQRPAPAEGAIFKSAWFRSYRAPSPGYLVTDDGATHAVDGLIRFATCDLAASTREGADYTVITVFGRASDGRLFLLDLVRARMEGPDLVPAIRRACEKWRLAFVAIEKNGFQLAIVQQARREGLPVRELSADRDKVARALAATPAFEAGAVLFPAGAPWRADLEAEMLAFPAGAHDDQVDALCYGVAYAVDFALPPREPLIVGPSDDYLARVRAAGPGLAGMDWTNYAPNPPRDWSVFGGLGFFG